MANSPDQRIYEFGDFRLDADHLMLSRGRTELALAPKAVETLVALVERGGEIVSKEELLQAVWPDTAVEESNLFLYLSILRKTLGTQSSGDPWIETLRRRGYRFNARATRCPSPEDTHCAWIDERSDDNEAKVKTQSGRIYVLKDWERESANRVEGSESAVKALTKYDEHKLKSELPATSLSKVSLDEMVGPNRAGRKKSWFRPAALLLIVIGLLSVAAISTYRLSRPKLSAEPDLSVTSLTNGVDVQNTAISRDGRTFAFHTYEDGHYRVFLQQVGEANSVEIISRTTTPIGPKVFSPDGSYIYYLAKEPGAPQLTLYRIPSLGGPSKIVLSRVFTYSVISFSPDGSRFVFADYDEDTKTSSLVIVSADGIREREVLSSTTEWLTYPAWSPDGSTIAYARARPKLKMAEQFVTIEGISPLGGEQRTLLDEKLNNCHRIGWTSDGRGIVFGGTQIGDQLSSRRDQVWHADLASKKLRRISPEGSRYTFDGISADNSVIATSINRPSQIWSVDANGDSKSARQLTRGSTDGRTGIAPLPDGKVGYMTRSGDNWEIWTVNGDGADAKQVYKGNPIIEELRASKDGKYFIFNGDVNGNYQLFRMSTTGSDLRQLTVGDETFIYDSSPAPDGSAVTFVRVSYAGETPSTSLYKVPMEGGETEKVPTESSGPHSPHHSPDGRYLSYIDTASEPYRIVIQSLIDGTSRYFKVIEANQLNLGAIWTPDSKELAYVVYTGKAANIWLQPISGGDARQLTDFSAGRIYRVAYSSDGKRIYLARGYAVNDAVLIKGFTQ